MLKNITQKTMFNNLIKGDWKYLPSFKIIDIICILIGILVFCYVLLRAIYVPPIGDETSTFLFYIQTGSFQPFYAHPDVNNHVINSLFAFLSYQAFGSKIFFLRLPNVISFLVFMFYVWKFRSLFRSNIIGASWFVAMITAQYFLTFFNLCRGYGMSMAFLTGACYYLVVYNSQSKFKYICGGLFMASLALWANLSLMIPVLIFGGIFLFLFIKKSIFEYSLKIIVSGIAVTIILYILPVVYAVFYSLKLQNSGALYFGRSKNFIESVFLDLSCEFAFGSYAVGTTIFWMIIFVVITAGIIFVIKEGVKLKPHILFQLLFWGTIMGIVLLHHLFGVNYPYLRSAIYFFVLLMGVLFFSLDQVKWKISKYIALITSFIFVVQLILVMNLSYAYHWKDEAIPVSFYNQILLNYQKTGQLPTISCSGLPSYVFQYYDFQNGGILNKPQDEDYPSSIADFTITSHLIEKDQIVDYDTLQFIKETGCTLLKRKEPFKWEKVITLKDKGEISSGEYIIRKDIPVNQFKRNSFCFDIEFYAVSQYVPLKWEIIISVMSDSNAFILYDNIDLQRTNPNITQKTFIHRKQYYKIMPETAEKISIYIWNSDNKKINISDLKISLYKGSRSMVI